VCRLTLGLAAPSLRLFLHYRDAGAVHLNVEDGKRFADDDGQIQLDGFPDLLLLALSDVVSNRFGGALHRFGGHLQSGQDPHLLAALIERNLLTDDRLHAPDAGGELGMLDVQFDIGGELTRMAMRAKIVGA
jgi:hypothetical protein